MAASTVALGAIVAACTSPQQVPGPATAFPPRPANVDIARLQPCRFLSDDQVATLRLSDGRAGQATVNGQPSAVCTWLGDDGIDYNIQQIPIGAEVATSTPDAVPVQVGGFGAIQNVPQETMGGTPFCQVTVDAADGQSVRVQAKTRPRGPGPGIDEQCRRASKVASMVMTTVVATASR